MWKIAPVLLLAFACAHVAPGAPAKSRAGQTPGVGIGLDGGPCCRQCDKGKPCGDGCISWDYECHQTPGCACI